MTSTHKLFWVWKYFVFVKNHHGKMATGAAVVGVRYLLLSFSPSPLVLSLSLFRFTRYLSHPFTGVFVMYAVAISLFTISMHLSHYTVHQHQRFIVRILLMVCWAKTSFGFSDSYLLVIHRFLCMRLTRGFHCVFLKSKLTSNSYATATKHTRFICSSCYWSTIWKGKRISFPFSVRNIVYQKVRNVPTCFSFLEGKPAIPHPWPLNSYTFQPNRRFYYQCKTLILQFTLGNWENFASKMTSMRILESALSLALLIFFSYVHSSTLLWRSYIHPLHHWEIWRRDILTLLFLFVDYVDYELVNYSVFVLFRSAGNIRFQLSLRSSSQLFLIVYFLLLVKLYFSTLRFSFRRRIGTIQSYWQVFVY